MNRNVYLIRCDATDSVKIGIARDPLKRLAALQTANPSPLRLLGSVVGGSDVEAQLHARFAEKRLTGEWFRLTNEDVTAILGGVEGGYLRLMSHDGELWAHLGICGIHFLAAVDSGLPMLNDDGGIFLKATDVIAWHEDEDNRSDWDAETLEAVRRAVRRYHNGEFKEVG